ncbi:MAG: 50S ribosomal protein L25 [Candidatus Zixiibacteriota bacterium]
MRETTLAVATRDDKGKNHARRIRREGRVPAALYGPERDPRSVSLSLADLERVIRESRGGNVMLDLDIDGSGPSGEKSLIRTIQRDPVNGEILHVDLHQISMTRPINLTIPVSLNGIPEGVKTHGGVMQQIVREIEISCLPTEIPEGLELDVTELGIHDSLHVSDVSIPNATILFDPKRTIVTVVPPTVSAEPAAEEEAELEEGAEGEAAAPAEEGKDKEEAETKDEEKK